MPARRSPTGCRIDVLSRRYRWSDLAIKVVGVDSVETRSFIVPMSGRDGHDPFSLQNKEAGAQC